MKSKIELLRQMYLGAIVAEQDDLLGKCFVRHPVLGEVLQDRKDLVLGAKGSGKSAIWKELKDNKATYDDIQRVDLRLVTNATGDPEFRDVLAAAAAGSFPDVEGLRVAWRVYLLGQFWEAAQPYLDEKTKSRLGATLARHGLVEGRFSGLKRAFAFAVAKAQALQHAEFKWTEGLALRFSEADLRAGGSAAAIPFNDVLSELDLGLRAVNWRSWLILDRLDEIVLGDETRENAVLKGLLYAFRDLSDRPALRVKVFLRDDVYDRVTADGGFAALTHVRSRAAGPINWTIDDLLDFAVRRLAVNGSVLELLGLESFDPTDTDLRKVIFYSLFPDKVDKGRAAEGFKWIVDRIKDGNDVATPRDLLSVLDAARIYQIEAMQRDAVSLPGDLLFSEDSLRAAVKKVARENLETRIFAEYPDLRDHILKFEKGKADHNEETLREILGDDWQALLRRLVRVGFFFSRTRNNVEMWTIPFFYTFAIDARRGAAFDFPGDDELEVD